MNKQPQLMDLSRMRDILAPHLSQISESIFFNGELGMVHGDHTVFRLLMRQKPPFTINDHRFGLILNGEAHINFNLQERHVTAGTLVYIGPGTIINPIRLSDDLRIFGFALFANFPMPFAHGQTSGADSRGDAFRQSLLLRKILPPPHRSDPHGIQKAAVRNRKKLQNLEVSEIVYIFAEEIRHYQL